MAQKIITITSDYGNRDYYAAAVTGKLLSLSPDVVVVPVSHMVTPYNIYQASFIVRNAWHHFPKNTVHMVLVNGSGDHDAPQVAIRYQDHFFVGPDSGIFGLIFPEKPDEVISIRHEGPFSPVFPELEISTRAAAALCEGAKLAELGDPNKGLLDSMPFRPVTENNVIKGMVIYMDNYHNIITNISRSMFDRMNKNNSFDIKFGKYHTNRIMNAYDYAPEGELVAVFNSADLLEIALFKSSARDLLGIRFSDIVRVEFD